MVYNEPLCINDGQKFRSFMDFHLPSKMKTLKIISISETAYTLKVRIGKR